MNADRANEIMGEEAWLVAHILKSGERPQPTADDPLSAEELFSQLLADSPAEVRSDAMALAARINDAIEAWQREKDRIIDGRVAVIALELMARQYYRAMMRILDEDVGPRGPFKN